MATFKVVLEVETEEDQEGLERALREVLEADKRLQARILAVAETRSSRGG